MATAPSFIGAPRMNFVRVTGGNTNLDGSGTIDFLTAGSGNGSRILEISAIGDGTVTAGFVNIFVSEDSGTTYRLYDQIALSAATPSTSVAASRNRAMYSNLVLTNATYQIGVAFSGTGTVVVHSMGGDL